ncbi:uncharacterized protein LOC110191866 [Drosophila serrata]|uniref:uncharacterized protein LOC110191866 n=1 Tax=Drosophila serrata TaxID=7274 RepID=UPI000A1D1BDB|nr:uncharacterized protein LOC110191866 [Drosophila serrata]
MDYTIEETAISLIIRLDEWSKAKEVKPGETGRIIAAVLAIIVICYIILFVARIVASLTLPVLVIMGLLVIYRCVSISEVVEGIKELPYMLVSFLNSIVDFIRKANFIRRAFVWLCAFSKILDLFI